MNLKINIKELIKGILVICLYFILGVILQTPFIFLYQKNIITEELVYILLYLSLSIVFILIYLKDMKMDFKSFKKDYKFILKTTFNYWLKGLLIMLAFSFIISFFDIAPNANQEANVEMFKQMPIFEILGAVIFAPITEELIFRRGLKNFTNNKHIYAITTGLIFGLIHILSSIQSPNDYIMFIYLIPYSSVGIAFGYAYSKTNNIYGSIIIHALHNAISLIELAIIGGLL